MVLGLKHNTNVLVDYDPQWPVEFAAEHQRISVALGGLAKEIEHYGSTSVPGMRAKPILDIIIGLAPLSDCKPAMTRFWRSDTIMRRMPACRAIISSGGDGTTPSGRTSSILCNSADIRGFRTWRSGMRCAAIKICVKAISPSRKMLLPAPPTAGRVTMSSKARSSTG